MSSLIIEVCKILDVKSIEKADKLEVVTVKGWQCVVSKGQYKVGDLVVYCPPDSIIPEPLIDKYNLTFLKKNGRVGTIKLRGQISQGLILDCPEQCNKEGQDVAKILNITKYELPDTNITVVRNKETIISIFIKFFKGEMSFRRFCFKIFYFVKDSVFKRKKKINPFFDKYTDIENIKNYYNSFVEGEEVVITEKVHGTNVRYGNIRNKWGKIEFCLGSRNVQLTWGKKNSGYYDTDVYTEIAERYRLDEILPEGYIFYGEIYGKDIQSNYNYGLKHSIDIVFFDIKDIKSGRYLSFQDKIDMFTKLNLPRVPILYKGKYTKEILHEFTGGESYLYNNQVIEGCVVTPIIENYDNHYGRKILKSINPEYLLLKNNTDFH